MNSKDTEKEIQEETQNENNNPEGSAANANNEESGPIENGTEANGLEKQVQELKEQNQTLNEKYLRLYSEFDNYRKRSAKEKIETVATAGSEIITTLLPVLDDFERAIKSAETTTEVEPIKEGTKLIYNKFLGNLTRKGLEPMKAVGETFDPEFHEAITNIPAPSEDMIGKVVDEVEKGYLLNGKVIRYAKVVVGN